MAHAGAVPGLPELLEHIHNQLLPEIRIHCPDPHDPVRVLSLPRPWRILGCGNYAAVLHHPHHPALVVKVYGPGRPGLEQEAEVYRRIGSHPAFSQCLHVGAGYLVLRRLHPPAGAVALLDVLLNARADFVLMQILSGSLLLVLIAVAFSRLHRSVSP